jgi:hypothetical protein
VKAVYRSADSAKRLREGVCERYHREIHASLQ